MLIAFYISEDKALMIIDGVMIMHDGGPFRAIFIGHLAKYTLFIKGKEIGKGVIVC